MDLSSAGSGHIGGIYNERRNRYHQPEPAGDHDYVQHKWRYDLANCTGSTVQITSTNGDIDTEACVINDLQVNNTAGSIDLEIDAQTATVVNASGEVDVKLRGTNSDYTVQTQTTSGRAKAGTGTGSRMISITTESGEIEYEFVNHWIKMMREL